MIGTQPEGGATGPTLGSARRSRTGWGHWPHLGVGPEGSGRVGPLAPPWDWPGGLGQGGATGPTLGSGGSLGEREQSTERNPTDRVGGIRLGRHRGDRYSFRRDSPPGHCPEPDP